MVCFALQLTVSGTRGRRKSERTKCSHQIAQKEKEKSPSVDTKIFGDSLFVNGQRYYDRLPKPSPRDIFFMQDAEKKDAQQTKFVTSRTITEQGSSFILKCVHTQSMNDVRAAYKAVLLDPLVASATHVAAAYRIRNSSQKCEDGYNDDSDYGLARAARDELRKANKENLTVFIIRQYGGTHLGLRRFKIVEQLTGEVVEKVPAVL